MAEKDERRRFPRIDARRVPLHLRGCDLCVVDKGIDIDVTIEDVNRTGMRLQIGGEMAEGNMPSKGDRVFIRGCVFDELLGFLSSEDATVAWCRFPSFGIVFDSPVDCDEGDLECLAGKYL